MTTTEQVTKKQQDYTNCGFGIMNTYTKIFTTTDGEKSWNTGRVKFYTYEKDGIESKKYYSRGWACKAMIKASIK